jgi:surfactin synthase thioesterase subunit
MGQLNAESGLWILPLTGKTPREIPLVCFPHAGGSATFFLPLARALPDSTEVLGVQYPGRQERRAEPLIENIEEFAKEISEALQPWRNRPLVLFGHSMGATIAFEVARRLEAEGDVPVSGLIASARRAPSVHRDDDIHRRDDNGLLAEVRALNGTHPSLLDDEELVQMLLPAVRGDYKAIETYRYTPGPALRCPITALIGDADPRVTVDEARAWGQHTLGEFQICVFPGGHFYFNTQVTEVVNTISAHLNTFRDAARGV